MTENQIEIFNERGLAQRGRNARAKEKADGTQPVAASKKRLFHMEYEWLEQMEGEYVTLPTLKHGHTVWWGCDAEDARASFLRRFPHLRDAHVTDRARSVVAKVVKS